METQPEKKNYFIKKNPDTVKKIKKPKKFLSFQNSFKLIEIGKIENVTNPKCHKKKKIKIKYQNDKGKLLTKTIRFADDRKKDFYNGTDEVKTNVLNRLGRTNNFLHENFWRANLLNGNSKNIEDNLNNLKNSL